MSGRKGLAETLVEAFGKEMIKNKTIQSKLIGGISSIGSKVKTTKKDKVYLLVTGDEIAGYQILGVYAKNSAAERVARTNPEQTYQVLDFDIED